MRNFTSRDMLSVSGLREVGHKPRVYGTGYPKQSRAKFAPRRAPFPQWRIATADKPTPSGWITGKDRIGHRFLRGIIAREQSSRERTNRYYPSENQSNGVGASRPPRVYHAAPARPAKSVRAVSTNNPHQKSLAGPVKRVAPSSDQKPARKPAQGQGCQNGGGRRSSGGGRGFRKPRAAVHEKARGVAMCRPSIRKCCVSFHWWAGGSRAIYDRVRIRK